MSKIAIIVQRYGKEVNGGAELHAKLLAHQLAKKHTIEILTTTAIEYNNWANHYPSGKQTVDGIDVIRFSTISKNHKKYRAAARTIYNRTKPQKFFKKIGLLNFLTKHTNWFEVTESDCKNWLRYQGPYCPDMIQYITENKDTYDVFIFFTYLYYPTVIGMPLVKDKAIFIPTAHDEPPLYTKPYLNVFRDTGFIMYNTEDEKELVENQFPNACKNNDIAGVGIEKSNTTPKNTDTLETPYFIYVGRIDVSKGCEEMIEYFLEAKKSKELTDVKLVLVGKNFMSKEYKHPDIIYKGFVDEETKYQLLTNAVAMIMPSFYESLSMVTLEAMMEKTPVIVNRKCKVLHSHIEKSNSGASYETKEEFTNELIKYLNKDTQQLETEKNNAQQYVLNNYSWETISTKFDQAIDFLMNKKD